MFILSLSRGQFLIPMAGKIKIKEKAGTLKNQNYKIRYVCIDKEMEIYPYIKCIFMQNLST